MRRLRSRTYSRISVNLPPAEHELRMDTGFAYPDRFLCEIPDINLIARAPFFLKLLLPNHAHWLLGILHFIRRRRGTLSVTHLFSKRVRRLLRANGPTTL